MRGEKILKDDGKTQEVEITVGKAPDTVVTTYIRPTLKNVAQWFAGLAGPALESAWDSLDRGLDLEARAAAHAGEGSTEVSLGVGKPKLELMSLSPARFCFVWNGVAAKGLAQPRAHVNAHTKFVEAKSVTAPDVEGFIAPVRK